jgi:hypothetical protein
VPFALAQTAPGPGAAPPAASSRGYEMGPGMMYDQGQAQTRGQVQVQRPGGYGPETMGSQGQGPGGYGPGMMGGYGVGWMGGYGGIWIPILLLLAVVGLVVWVVKLKAR